MAEEKVEVSIGAKIDELITEFKKASDGVSTSVKQISTEVQQAMQKVENSTNEATTSLRRVEAETKSISGSMSSALGGIGNMFSGMLGGILAGFTLDAAISTVLDFADAAESLGNTAQIIGTTATELSRLHATAVPMGIAAESVDTGMKKLARTLTDARRGGEEAALAFEAVGLKGEELDKLSLPEVLAKISDKFADAEDGATKTALAQALLGRSGADLIPWLNQGSEAMREQADEAERMGAVMGDDAVAAGEALDAAWDKLTMQGTGLKNLFAQSLAPVLEFIAEAFMSDSNAAMDFGTVFKAVGTVVMATVSVVQQAWNVVSSIVRAITISLSAIIDSVVKAASMDWSGAKNALQTGNEMIKEELTGMLDNAQQIGGRFGTAMAEMWGGAEKPKAQGNDTTQGGTGQLDFKDKGSGSASASAAKEAAKAAQQAAREKFEYEMELMRNELAELDRGAQEKIQIAARMVEAVKAQYGEESKEYARAQREQVRIVEEVEAEKRRIQLGALDRAREAGIAEVNLAREQANYLVSTGQVSAVERVEIERRAQEQIYALQLSYLEQKRLLMATEPQEVERINAEIAKLRAEHLVQLQQTDTAAFEANKAQWDGYFSSITDGFGNAINGMVFQGLTLQQAMGNIFQNILGQLIQTGVKMAANWVTTQLAMTSATVAGAATRTTAEVASAKASTMANAGAAIKNIMTKAVEVFANVYNAIAGIPYVGPFLAPVMAVAAGATIVGLVGKVASAEGGWDRVPYDGAQAILHKEEMVLPAPLAEGIRGLVESGQRGGGGVTIHALDRRDVQRYFDDNADSLMRSLALAQNNNPGGL